MLHWLQNARQVLRIAAHHPPDPGSWMPRIEEIEVANPDQSWKNFTPPITTIPGIGYRMGAMILAEVGDFSRFDSPDKLLAYAGMSPSTYQSGQLKNCYPHMEKRGSRYLRYALYNAAKYVCHWDPAFAAYLAKKRAEGKHYNIALSHAAKKLVRLIFALEKSRPALLPGCLIYLNSHMGSWWASVLLYPF